MPNSPTSTPKYSREPYESSLSMNRLACAMHYVIHVYNVCVIMCCVNRIMCVGYMVSCV